MQLDGQAVLSDGQTINTTENSDNYYDAGAAIAIGQGEGVQFLLQVDSEANTDNTLVATLVGADDTGFSSNKVTITSISKVAADDVPFHREVPVPANYKKRYYRVEYTVGGSGPPSMVCEAYLKFGAQADLDQSTQRAIT